jgi:hypothetical protein
MLLTKNKIHKTNLLKTINLIHLILVSLLIIFVFRCLKYKPLYKLIISFNKRCNNKLYKVKNKIKYKDRHKVNQINKRRINNNYLRV